MSTISDPLSLGRDAYERRAWRDAFESLSEADQRDPLSAEDLDRLARAAFLIGRVDDADGIWERAHLAFLDRGEIPAAVRCAFWLGMALLLRGEHARGGGWLGRARRLLDGASIDCVERGYLGIPSALQSLAVGDPEGAHRDFVGIAALADRFGDTDLQALGRLGQGQSLIAQGRAAQGVAMLDEAMVAITTGEVSVIAVGIVYCSTVLACREIFDLRRAQEWTAMLSRWCAAQQGLRPYRGQCLVHRSEIMQMRGEWDDAMREAREACRHTADPPGDPATGMALYQLAELHRLRGELGRAESGYREADEWGHPVQPGLALLRLAQGRVGDARAAIQRSAVEADGPVERLKVLSALVEIKLAAGEAEDARAAADELAAIAAGFDSPYLRAVVGYAHGSVLLAEGELHAACVSLRRSWTDWHELEAPYEAALVRLRMAEAFGRLGDRDSAAMERDAARRVFEQLGAAPVLASMFDPEDRGESAAAGGLTPREIEVLRLVATGATNRQIAASLVISEKTVARHLSNMFTKLGLSSRAAATAYAYEHDLV